MRAGPIAENALAEMIAVPGRRYCFLLPDLWRPMGGQAVLYDMATAMQEMGRDAVLVHAGPRHHYPFADPGCEIFHLPALGRFNPPNGVQDRLHRVSARLQERLANPRTPRFRASASDVFLVPEFCYHKSAGLFPDRPLVLVVQDPTALLRAYCNDKDGLYRRFASVLATSEAAVKAVRVLLGREPLQLTLPVVRSGLRADHPKKMQIAYMPRKLRTQSLQVVTALKRRSALADMPIVAIENMSNEERDRVLNESLVFLSFSNMEGFGLPPAEAMAAGCLVIGYTGVGGNEFFTAETGFVIEQHDTPHFVAQVEQVIAEYRNDPVALDQKRAAAAEFIATRYSAARARQSLSDALVAIQAELQGRHR